MIRQMIMSVILLAGVGCGPIVMNATLVPNVPTQTAISQQKERVYHFDALPNTPTTLRLSTDPPRLPYVAEVRDSDGQIVASLSGGGALTQATVPAGSGAYEVRVRTDAEGTVQLIVTGHDTNAPTQRAALAPTINAPEMAGVCRLDAAQEANVLVRGQPGLAADPIGTLNGQITAEVRTSADGDLWYRVRAGEAVGWVSASFVVAEGTCDALPVVVPPQTAPQISAVDNTGGPAPFDADSYDVTINADTGGTFTEQVSYPDGDHIDRLWLVAGTPDANRLFTVRMTCEGSGAGSLRWGTPDNPALGCGGALNTTFTPELSRRSLLVTMPDGSAPGRVRYRVDVNPTAPEDAETFLFTLHKDTGGRASEAVSYPAGDTTDTYVFRVEDFAPQPPENQRSFAVYMVCQGANADALRWGEPDTPRYQCNQTVYMTFDTARPQRTVRVALPEGSASGYLAYSLFAVPIAPRDSETYLFTADRNTGGQFGESLSSPQGDTTDTIQFTASNLTETPPHNFRQFQMTLVCSGSGVEQVRWGVRGSETLGCGGSATVPLMANAAGQTVVVSVPGGSAFVNYTLVAQPVLP